MTTRIKLRGGERKKTRRDAQGREERAIWDATLVSPLFDSFLLPFSSRHSYISFFYFFLLTRTFPYFVHTFHQAHSHSHSHSHSLTFITLHIQTTHTHSPSHQPTLSTMGAKHSKENKDLARRTHCKLPPTLSSPAPINNYPRPVSSLLFTLRVANSSLSLVFVSHLIHPLNLISLEA